MMRHLMTQKELVASQERRMIGITAKLINSRTKEEMSKAIHTVLPSKTYLCLRSSFMDVLSGESTLMNLTEDDTFFVISSADGSMDDRLFDHDMLYERAMAQSKNAAPLILYPVYAREEYYGFVVSEAPGFFALQMMMQRVLIAFNHSLSYLVRDIEVFLRNEEIRDMSEYLENIHYRDAMTGMLNNNGLATELENCKRDCLERKQTIHFVCVDLDHLGNINDIYGHSEGDEAILALSRIIKDGASKEDLTAHIGSDEFIVVIRTEESNKGEVDYFLGRIKELVSDYNKRTKKEYTLNINVSTTVVIPYEDTDMVKVIDEALLNKRINKNNRKSTAAEGEELTDAEIKISGLIKDIIDNNRFRYAFQPIVNAKNGEIFGYEALMRSDTDEPVTPLSIIKYSTINKRLYDIERATFFNVLDTVSKNKDKTEGKTIFVNSIPGFMLDSADFERLKKTYPGLLKQFYVEVTEQAEQEDDELRILSERSNEEGFGIVIDDYGVGYANTTSLLRYTPSCVKIDRLLIQNLQDDPRKQHFVKNIIEFAHDNHFYALAEGVETIGELKASIMLGADLIQGFYTAKPSFEIAESIPEQIQDEIIECNQAPEEKKFTKLYVVSREKELILTRLALEMYTDIMISGQNVVINGNADYPAAVKIRIKENTNSKLTLRNVILDCGKGETGIEIGENASLTLTLEGDNYINSNGISVPATSSLKIVGTGNLHINSDAKEAFGIGNDMQHPFGNIETDISGNLEIELNGEKAYGIGGVAPGPNAQIILHGGDNNIKASSTAFVGIGAFSGMVKVRATEMHLAITYNVINGIAVGSPSGTCALHLESLLLEIKGGGKSITGLGCAAKGENTVEIVAAEVNINMNAPRVIMVGCALGRSKIYVEHTKLTLNGSGGQILAMGTTDMGGEIVLNSVGCFIKLSSDAPLPIGALKEKCDFGASVPEIEVINYSAPANTIMDAAGAPAVVPAFATGVMPNLAGLIPDGPPPGVGGPPPGVGGPPPGAGGPPA
jgi:diguanylate cyclase (GGDEF)-like protein